MADYSIILPSKPRVVSEEENKGIYEIDNLYPGYGHTLGNSLRRIILSSLPGVAITSFKIDGASHEFSTIEGLKEDVVIVLLNLKRIRFKMLTDEPQKVKLHVKGPKVITAKMIETPSQVEILNSDQYIAETTGKNIVLNIEMTLEKGLGFATRDILEKSKVEIGTIVMDAIFTPIRRVSYEVENMRVGDKTNHNRLRMFIETDGSLSPRDALLSSVKIMVEQLSAIADIMPEKKETLEDKEEGEEEEVEEKEKKKVKKEDYTDVLKTRIDDLNLSTRTFNALEGASIRTLGGIARKSEEDLLEVEGMGEKSIQEIKKVLSKFDLTLK